MLWIRRLIFTLLVPGVVAVVIPHAIDREVAGGWWWIGAPFVIAGFAVYSLCLAGFLTSGGTPAVYFTRKLRALIGEEPPRLVAHGLYRVSRNPMYLGVLAVVFGQALLSASAPIAKYGVILAVAFHLTVVFIEEPQLRQERGRLVCPLLHVLLCHLGMCRRHLPGNCSSLPAMLSVELAMLSSVARHRMLLLMSARMLGILHGERLMLFCVRVMLGRDSLVMLR